MATRHKKQGVCCKSDVDKEFSKVLELSILAVYCIVMGFAFRYFEFYKLSNIMFAGLGLTILLMLVFIFMINLGDLQ